MLLLLFCAVSDGHIVKSVAVAVTVLALMSCTQASGESKAPAPATTNATAISDPSASFLSQITAAIKTAEEQPHGDIGESATATVPSAP